MTHAELIASIPTKGVECKLESLRLTAVFYKDGMVLTLDNQDNAFWQYPHKLSPLPERVTRPMTDREMFGLFAQGAEVHNNEGTICYGWSVFANVDNHEYRLPGSTEWSKCEVEVNDAT